MESDSGRKYIQIVEDSRLNAETIQGGILNELRKASTDSTPVKIPEVNFSIAPDVKTTIEQISRGIGSQTILMLIDMRLRGNDDGVDLIAHPEVSSLKIPRILLTVGGLDKYEYRKIFAALRSGLAAGLFSKSITTRKEMLRAIVLFSLTLAEYPDKDPILALSYLTVTLEQEQKLLSGITDPEVRKRVQLFRGMLGESLLSEEFNEHLTDQEKKNIAALLEAFKLPETIDRKGKLTRQRSSPSISPPK